MCQEWWCLIGTQKKAQEMCLSSHEDEILEGKSANKLANGNITSVVCRKIKVQGTMRRGRGIRVGFLEVVTVELKD